MIVLIWRQMIEQVWRQKMVGSDKKVPMVVCRSESW